MKRLAVMLLAAIAGALICLSMPLEAKACNRCGLFNSRCKFQQSHHVAAYVAPAVYKPQDVLVIQNNYPAPLAIQGSTQYSYQSAAAAYFVSPAEVLRQAASLATAASQTAQLGLTGYNQTAQTQLSLQATIAEPLLRSQAAVQVLGAAGLSQPYQQQQSHAFRITIGPNGPQITQENPQQLSASVTARLGQANGTAPQPQAEEPAPRPSVSDLLISTKCTKCHGVQLQEPKDGKYIDTEANLGRKLDCNLALKSQKAVLSGRMPPPSEPPLTREEKGTIIAEILGLAESE